MKETNLSCGGICFQTIILLIGEGKRESDVGVWSLIVLTAGLCLVRQGRLHVYLDCFHNPLFLNLEQNRCHTKLGCI